MTQHGDVFERVAIEYAMLLVGRVKDYDPPAIADLLNRLSRKDLEAVAVALASTVDEDKTASELFRWLGLAHDSIEAGCHPSDWGKAAGKAITHGRRGSYNRGCRGEACSRAAREYDTEHKAEKRRQNRQQSDLHAV